MQEVLLSDEPLHRGYRKLNKRIYKLSDGSEADYEIFMGGLSVCVLALTPEQQVLLVKIFRPGPQKELLELPGGGANKDEPLEEAMARELLEETGYSGNVRHIGTSYADAYSTTIRHNFVATDCHRVQDLPNVDREPTELVLMSLEEFRQHLRSGELSDVATGYMGLDFLGLL
jgi:ADP-ribose pyrophosphatase